FHRQGREERQIRRADRRDREDLSARTEHAGLPKLQLQQVIGFILAQCLSALSQAAILFFIACGLTLIFGIMRIVNFAHGVIFMLGAYSGSAAAVSGSFLVSLIVAPIVVGAVGMAFERIFLRPLYGRRDGGAYLLLTFGLAVVLSELIRIIWGAQPLSSG